MISDREIKSKGKDVKTVLFISAEELQIEYKAFSKQARLKRLIITGDEEKIWNVFRSLFSYIEASGGIVKNEKDELLLIYRNHHWDLPKGKMEKGETPAETALREVEEECGVKNLKIIKQLSSTYHIFFQNNECMKRTYWFEMTCKDSAKLTPQAEEGIKEAKWMSKEEVKKIANKIYPSLREILSLILSPSP
ncbi:MAG: NUDIX domain-containing protein [Candidatus Diapherotrites archaeon]|nr:NUDIX domain-containing protein [Candidatus Diapherotrites archaeon]